MPLDLHHYGYWQAKSICLMQATMHVHPHKSRGQGLTLSGHNTVLRSACKGFEVGNLFLGVCRMGRFTLLPKAESAKGLPAKAADVPQ